MKRARLISALALALLLPSPVVAADFLAQGTTIFRFEQRAVPGFNKENLVPLTQFVGADVDKIADGNLSLHLYGWGRVDLSGNSTNEGTTDGDLAYGFLEYRLPKGNAEVKGGRFFINQGVAVEQIDGVSAQADLGKGFALFVFTGAPVKLDRGNNTKGNFIAGGRGSYRLNAMFEVGISGLHETGGTYDPTAGVKKDRQLAGGDIWLSTSRYYQIDGHSFYNTATDGFAEHSYVLTLRPHKVVTVSGQFNEVDLRHYFTSSNLRSLFNPDTGGKVTSYGGMVTWYVAAPLEVSGDFKRIRRTDGIEVEKNGNSNRFGAEARLLLLDKKVRTGLSYHRVEGATGFNTYDEVRGFGMYDSGRYITSLDGIGQFYKARIFNTRESFEIIASGGMRVWPELALSGEVSYGQNPWYADEVKGLVRLTFNYANESKGAKK